MKTWDDWSDFDISLAVAKFVAIDGLVESNGKSVHIPEYHKRICLGWKTFWVSNPADMWPIILQNDISLINDKGFYYATSNCYETFEPHGLGVADGYFYSKAKDKSELLRAAAIVFLMMNGVNQE